jgi:short-subunit dehydrogenase
MPVTKILITGASSGLGAALARAHARAGVTLVLWGRDAARLNATALHCREQGAATQTDNFDLRDPKGLVDRLAACGSQAPIDLAIFCAGIGGTVPANQFAQDPGIAEAMAQVNFVSPAIGANFLSGVMAGRGHGHIVLVGSVAESFPLPMAPIYSGSKAGLAMFAEALGLRVARHGVAVTLVSPGFIDTPMSRPLTQAKPFLMSADRAAEIIARELKRRPARITVPWQFAWIRALAKCLPHPLLRQILRRA